jgi:hypothetical protein
MMPQAEMGNVFFAFNLTLDASNPIHLASNHH